MLATRGWYPKRTPRKTQRGDMGDERAAERLVRVRAALAGGRSAEAIDLAGSLLTDFPDAGARLRALTLQLGGTALQMAGRPRDAGEWARRGLRLAIREAREPRLVAPLLGLLGESAQAEGRLPRALTCFRHAERRFREHGAPNGVASARANAALVLLRQGERDAARRDLLAAAGAFLDAGNPREAARVRLILSDLLRERGDLAGALAALDAAEGALHEHGGADLTVELTLRRGLLAEAAGRPADAEAPYAKALATGDAAGLAGARPVVLTRLAELALLAGDGHVARALLQDVIASFRAGGARLRAASAALSLAACDELDQRFLDAEGAILEADRAFTDVGDERGRLAVRLARARLSQAEGRVDLAGRQLRGALAAAEQVSFAAAGRAARGSLLALAVHLGDLGGRAAEAGALADEMRAAGEGTSAVQASAVREVALWLEERRGRLVEEPRAWIEGLAGAGFRALAREMVVLAAFVARAPNGGGDPGLAAWGERWFRGADEGRWRDLDAIRCSLAGQRPQVSPRDDAPLRARFDAAEALRLGGSLIGVPANAVHAVVATACGLPPAA